jgi:hypothetical protein
LSRLPRLPRFQPIVICSREIALAWTYTTCNSSLVTPTPPRPLSSSIRAANPYLIQPSSFKSFFRSEHHLKALASYKDTLVSVSSTNPSRPRSLAPVLTSGLLASATSGYSVSGRLHRIFGCALASSYLQASSASWPQ